MPLTHRHSCTVQVDGRIVTSTKEIEGGAGASLSEPIPDNSTDLEIAFALDVSACKSFYITADRAMTIKTNSSSVPDATIQLAAGDCYRWQEDSAEPFLLQDDVTALFVTNTADELDGTLKAEALVDPTP
jgi:hypothetical protein